MPANANRADPHLRLRRVRHLIQSSSQIVADVQRRGRRMLEKLIQTVLGIHVTPIVKGRYMRYVQHRRP